MSWTCVKKIQIRFRNAPDCRLQMTDLQSGRLLARLSGTVASGEVFVSDSNEIEIEFSSDVSAPDSGFSLTVSQTENGRFDALHVVCVLCIQINLLRI